VVRVRRQACRGNPVQPRVPLEIAHVPWGRQRGAARPPALGTARPQGNPETPTREDTAAGKRTWRFGMLCTGEKLVAACMSPTNDVESLLPKTLTDDVEMEDTGPDSLLRCDEESSPSFRGCCRPHGSKG